MKVAIVTGGTRGIGRQIAIDLARDGYHVVINYNSSDALALDVKAECDQYQEALIVKGNVARPSDCEFIVEETIKKFSQIDLLVNNAGITKDNLSLRMSVEDFDDVIKVNLNGSFYMAKYASRYMMKKRSGVIINMSSVVGILGNIGQANYASSKGGIIALTKSFAREFASRNIRVNAIAPGYIQTDMTDKLSDDIKAKVVEQIPLRRMGNVQDISNLVLFLASDKASYITGQVINCCGGMAI